MGVNGQVADSLTLEAVQITATRIPSVLGSKTVAVDSTLVADYSSSGLSELLSGIGGFAIRSYGVSGASNVSLRGAGPQHTLLLWNGVPINDLMLGQADASTIPVSIGNDIEVFHGPSAMIHQPGGIGGAISISNSFKKKDGVEASLNLGYGSFSNYSGSASISTRRSIWASTTSMNYLNAKNDFPYRNLATHDKRIDTTSNAELERMSLQHSSLIELNIKNHLEVSLLGMRTERGLPSTMLEGESQENLEDIDAIGSVKWRHFRQRSNFSIQASYIYGNQKYRMSDTTYQFDHTYQNARLFFRYHLNIRKNLKLKVGLDGSSEFARSDSAYRYTPRKRFSEALFASLIYHPHKNVGLQLLIREDFIDDSFSPIQWSFGTSWKAFKWLDIKGNFSRNYRAPGLNDLYWQPGGNPDLQPETGLSYETGIAFSANSGRQAFHAEVTWFDSWINDMIIWVPGSGNIWSPQNKRQVRANGIEALISYQRNIHKWKVGFSGKYNWTRSIIQKSYSSTDAAIGKQLLNTPIHEAGLQVHLKWRYLSFSYGQTYMGQRPIASDNTSWLDAYTIGWIQVGANLPIKRNSLGLTAKFHNLWSTEYQHIKWRPMPRFNYSLTLKYQFK